MLVVDSDADEQAFLAAAALPQVAVVVYHSEFESTKEFVSKIEKAYKANGGTPLMSIAFANEPTTQAMIGSLPPTALAIPGRTDTSPTPRP